MEDFETRAAVTFGCCWSITECGRKFEEVVYLQSDRQTEIV